VAERVDALAGNLDEQLTVMEAEIEDVQSQLVRLYEALEKSNLTDEALSPRILSLRLPLWTPALRPGGVTTVGAATTCRGMLRSSSMLSHVSAGQRFSLFSSGLRALSKLLHPEVR